MKDKKIALIVIDPQYDFHDVPVSSQTQVVLGSNTVRVKPTLGVPGSWQDAIRLGGFINKFNQIIDNIYITLDMHNRYDISHVIYWVDKNGANPEIYTQITYVDVLNKKWVPAREECYEHALKYTKSLEDSGKKALIIWPNHCLVGEPGSNIVEPVMSSVAQWEEKTVSSYVSIFKGENPNTEHYGGLQAEYVIEDDKDTQLNEDFVNNIKKHDLNFISGQALSHCYASTIRQIIENLDPEDYCKLVILIDTTSAVPNFEKDADEFISEMKEIGIKILKTSEVIL